MAFTIGIDTGGTYTDSVLVDQSKSGAACVIKKAKAFTTHDELEQGIRNSLLELKLNQNEIHEIEKVVLSTTLATNSIVEHDIDKVGLILIGEAPRGNLAANDVKVIQGAVNIKGRVLCGINREELLDTVERMLENVNSIAVSGPYSTRNPVLETEVREIIREAYEVPIVCGHDLVSELGYLERTNTAVINAGLLPVIDRFVNAICVIMSEFEIKAPIFVVRGDGSTAKLEVIKERPVDTVLSGPAASMMGAVKLTGVRDGIITDMGGTTTDCGLIHRGRIALSDSGAMIGNWQLQIKSAKLYTFGLGGDSQIHMEDGQLQVGPKRVLPACRGGVNNVTPTDLVHGTGEFERWDQKAARRAITKTGRNIGLGADMFAAMAADSVVKKIYEECVLHDWSESQKVEKKLLICAIGAPAETWYQKAQNVFGFDLVVPENYEVANAVGAASSKIEENADVVVRPGEEGHGYLVHSSWEREFFRNRMEAINRAIEITVEIASGKILRQDLQVDKKEIKVEDLVAGIGGIIRKELQIKDMRLAAEGVSVEEEETYLETRVTAIVSGKIFGT